MYNNYEPLNNNQDRQFLFPFLLGGLGGAALTSVTRPRPVFVNNPRPMYYPPYPSGYGYNYYGGYNYNPYPYYR